MYRECKVLLAVWSMREKTETNQAQLGIGKILNTFSDGYEIILHHYYYYYYYYYYTGCWKNGVIFRLVTAENSGRLEMEPLACK